MGEFLLDDKYSLVHRLALHLTSRVLHTTYTSLLSPRYTDNDHKPRNAAHLGFIDLGPHVHYSDGCSKEELVTLYEERIDDSDDVRERKVLEEPALPFIHLQPPQYSQGTCQE